MTGDAVDARVLAYCHVWKLCLDMGMEVRSDDHMTGIERLSNFIRGLKAAPQEEHGLKRGGVAICPNCGDEWRLVDVLWDIPKPAAPEDHKHGHQAHS